LAPQVVESLAKKGLTGYFAHLPQEGRMGCAGGNTFAGQDWFYVPSPLLSARPRTQAAALSAALIGVSARI